MKRFMTSFFSNPYDIHVYGKIPDFINTALYLADINVQKLILKDPVVDGLSELYPISSNIELGINRVDRDHTIISFNGCIPFHICYSITDYLNRNNQ